jgi:purine-binding chemotaxis protein CheW
VHGGDDEEPAPSDRLSGPALLFATGPYRCALPLREVVETMRPLPIEPLPDASEFVRGAAVIRGEVLPVVDTGVLLGVVCRPGRFVIARAGRRQVALAVDRVEDIRDAGGARWDNLPPLLTSVQADLVTRIGLLDSGLLLLLGAARIVPDQVWARVDDLAAAR